MTRTETRRARPATALEALPAAYWSQMHRVCWPGRPDMPIDHVIVGPSGIYVIWYLTSEPDRSDARRDRGGPRSQDLGAAACAEYTDVISGLLPPRYRDRVRPVLCLGGDDERAEDSGGVLVASLGTFEHIVRSSPPVLSTSEVGQAYSSLRARLDQVPLVPDTSRRRLRVALRVAAASVAVAATSIGVVILGPDTIELFGSRG